MENEPSQISTGSGSAAPETTPTSTAEGIVLAIPEILFNTMEYLVQTNLFNNHPAGHTGVAWGIINNILRCKNMSKEIDSLHIQLDVTRETGAEAYRRLNQVLAREMDGYVSSL